MTADGHDTEHEHLGHVVSFDLFLKIFIALLILTVVTVAVAKMPMFDFGGNWNIVIAMLIASVKAALVCLFFMHLKYENPVTWLYVGFPVVLLILMVAGIFVDNPYRENPASSASSQPQATHEQAADHH